jgi:molybdopterin biosynthesis enzyme MoaB
MIRALAITVSNRAAAGVYEDRSGPVLVHLLRVSLRRSLADVEKCLGS